MTLTRTQTLALLAVCAAVGVLFFKHTLGNLYEDMRYRTDPTPARAFFYGERHFDATDPGAYDIARAEYFFNRAASDQSLPYVNHELARTAFLKGDFNRALALIDLQISLHGSSTPESYYVRGLIKGFRGEYHTAAKDYEIYLRADPTNWAAINDYAWVLLKAGRYTDALMALDGGLIYWPENPWLHNSRATALFELGHLTDAREAAAAASRASESVTEAAWLQAYPGNDPLIASAGVHAFKQAIADNMHSIQASIEVRDKSMQ